MIEERDEEFKATGTQNVGRHVGGAEADFEVEAASPDPKTPVNAGGLYVETAYKPAKKGEIKTAGTEPRSGMNRGVLSPSVGTPGGAAGRSSGLPSSNRNRAVSELTDESEYDSEEEEESSSGEDSGSSSSGKGMQLESQQ